MTKRKDGLWQEILKINGKTKYFYGKTKQEVLRKVREYEENQKSGRLFSEVAEEWWVEHQETLEWNTIKSYRPAKNRAIEHFSDKSIKDIAPPEISRYIKNFSRTHADKTVRTQLLIFNLIFKYAVEMGDIPYNPARDLEVPSGLPKQKITAPPQNEIEKVKQSYDCTFGAFAYWAMYTGLRRGELLALQWEDVDIKNRIITVNKSVYHINNRPHVKEPKTKTSIGTVPVLDALLKKIKKRRTGLVFPNQNGELISNTQFKRLWTLYQRETGITATPHQFRHAYATMLFEAGIPPEEMQILLRHAQLSTTMDIYTDIRDKKQKEVHKKVYSVDI